MDRNRRHFVYVGVLVVIGTVIVDVILESVLRFPAQASAEAPLIDGLFGLHIKIISFLFALIVAFMLYSVVVFRRKPGDESAGAYIHGHTRLEIIWTVVPLITVLFFGYLGARSLAEVTRTDANEMVVKVTGMQWSWRFDYPDEGITSSDLVLPKDRRVRLEMTSPDVIHSFWVPEFRVKQDLVPGMTTRLRFTPTEIGEYRLRCAELCGLSHAYMLAAVQVVSPADYDAWVAEQKAASDVPPAERGANMAKP